MERELIVALGSDHHGIEHKREIVHLVHIHDVLITWIDVGCYEEKNCDYPIYAQKVVQMLRGGNAHVGVLMCGTGIGMSIAANRFKGIYAALVWNKEVARLSREQDNANILVLPADFISGEQAVEMIKSWLTATFQGDRYQKRIALIDSLGE